MNENFDFDLENENNDIKNEFEGETVSFDTDGETVDFDAVADDTGNIEGFMPEEAETSSEEIPENISSAVGSSIPSPSANGKKKKKNKKSSRLKWWQHLLRFIIVCFCLCVIAGSVAAVAATMYLTDVTADDSKTLDLNQIKLSYATTLMAYDEQQGEWVEYERLYGDENRIWVNYSEMPDYLIKAAIASEDKRFLSHKGVDWKRTLFAFINEYVYRMSEDTQGGSTITQQLIKNLTTENTVSGLDGALRKLREIYRALELEKSFSKEQIMEAYLNTFGVGGNVAGIEAGANYYFGKTTSELSMAECAAIVCITKYPTSYNPYLYPEENHTQRNYVLYNMYDYGLITEEEYKAAKAESDAMVFDESNIYSASSSTVYSYFTDAAINEVITDLVEINGMTEEAAEKLLYEGGLTIYLTVDPFIQSTIEEVYSDESRWPEFTYDDDGNLEENQIQSAMCLMDYEGNVKGVAGGIGEKTASRSLNRAVDSLRQPGSSIKPLAVYAPAIELKKVHYSTWMPDQASEILDDEPWPRNYDRTYGNNMTIYEAVATSLNTIAIHTLNLVGYDFSFDFMTTSLGISSLVESRWSESQQKELSDRNNGLGIGALTDGISVMEMTAAYQVFGNGGVYHSPHFYTMICDRSGDVILDKTQYLTTSYAISEETACIVNHLLQGVVAEGSAKIKLDRFASGGKTGTSSDNNDFWIMGLNPYYVAGCWMGYDMNGYVYPYSLRLCMHSAWQDIMNTILADLPDKDFPTCDTVVTARFCMDSGDLATSSCTSTRIGYYTSDNMPGYCNHAYITPNEPVSSD